MFIKERFILLKAIDHLIEDHNYRIIYTSKNRDEYVLQKYDKRVNKILRFKQQTFDWANHLKRDIEQRIAALLRQKQFLKGKEIQMHFVYIADLNPVDDWEHLINTNKVKHSKPTNVSVYYLDQHNREQEWERFIMHINEGNPNLVDNLSHSEELERHVPYLEQKLQASLYKKQREIQEVFSFGKNRLTFLLIAANILIFLLLEMNGSTTNTLDLINWGAKYNPAIADGEWWRIFSSMFLHIGMLHILMNMIALYYLGDLTEKIYGTTRFFFIYFLAGIFGGLASYATNDSVAAGASGAIFGLFGALLFFGFHYKDIFFRTMGMNLLLVIGINIVFGVSVPQIDNGAHIGGLIGGLIASQIVHLPKRKSWSKQLIALTIFVAAVIVMFSFGTNNAYSSVKPETLGLMSYQYLEEQKFEKVLDILDEPIESGVEQDYLFYYRSIAYVNLEQIVAAKKDLKQAIKLNPDFAEGHYNLAILYIEEDNLDQAESHIIKALKIKPNDEKIKQLNEELSNLNKE
ncbi:rhomboid family intramembrane serine protease [Filobacillus milosensis]|uniref:Rhomboid family intramembrane serine protease n=1 Tax=Filobacillus milosensis TaxID=94137 RepID=A0A4Y8IQ48_9BACI|nr:rhomboid family intramembrane serine protease [Filobacillus milosensis]TFB23802.1 rhomboid family intramembrane serine protease [Filobacillus milosensis]